MWTAKKRDTVPVEEEDRTNERRGKKLRFPQDTQRARAGDRGKPNSARDCIITTLGISFISPCSHLPIQSTPYHLPRKPAACDYNEHRSRKQAAPHHHLPAPCGRQAHCKYLTLLAFLIPPSLPSLLIIVSPPPLSLAPSLFVSWLDLRLMQADLFFSVRLLHALLSVFKRRSRAQTPCSPL